MHDSLRHAAGLFIHTADAEHINNAARLLRVLQEQNPAATADIDELRALLVDCLPNENEEKIRYVYNP